jgi:hypothetical protein
MDQKKFYLETKSIVDRILMVGNNGLLLGEMIPTTTEEERYPEDNIIWNGTVSTSEQFIYLHILSGEGKTGYLFNDLFSKPIDVHIMKFLESQNVELFFNTVIINTPKFDGVEGQVQQSIKKVLLEFPVVWQQFWQLPPVEILTYIPLEKLKLEGSTGNPSDYFKLGFDPNAYCWSKHFNLKMPNSGFIRALDEASMDKLLQTKITIYCYISIIHARYHFKKDELEIIN